MTHDSFLDQMAHFCNGDSMLMLQGGRPSSEREIWSNSKTLGFSTPGRLEVNLDAPILDVAAPNAALNAARSGRERCRLPDKNE